MVSDFKRAVCAAERTTSREGGKERAKRGGSTNIKVREEGVDNYIS
jgi:hypothetical protein